MVETAQKLESIFTALLPNETVPPRQRTHLNCAGWDSLFKWNLIVSIEQAFQVALSDEEAIDLNSFESALSMIHAYQSSQRS